MIIRPVHEADIDALKKIAEHTFSESFAHFNTPENMAEYMDSAFSIDRLKYELDHPQSQFYFATLEGSIVGYLKVNVDEAQTEIPESNALEIERIYVLKEHHGSGIGQALFDKALDIAASRHVEFIWLGVWEKNERAVAFYHKNGFVTFDRHVFKMGDDPQVDIMMRREMVK